MNSTKLIGELANAVFNGGDEIRTLDDLELANAAGGDHVTGWNPPPPPPEPGPGP